MRQLARAPLNAAKRTSGRRFRPIATTTRGGCLVRKLRGQSESRKMRWSHQTGVSRPTVKPAKSCMPRVDDDVALHACHDRRDDQECTSVFGIPRATEAAGRLPARMGPIPNEIGRDHLIADAPWYRDLDEVLVRRRRSIPMGQRFQHGCRIGFGGVDYVGAGLVPPAGHASGACRAPHRKPASGIADPIGAHRPRERSRFRQTATPASARRMRFRTASAPAELERAMSNGVSPSSNGCGRPRNASIASRSPWYARLTASTTRPTS